MVKRAARDALPLVVIAHEDPGIADGLRHAVDALAAWRAAVAAPGPDGLAVALAAGEPAVAIVGCGRLAELPATSQVPVVAIGDDSRAEDLRAALDAGVRSILAWPDGAADLPGLLKRLASASQRRPRPRPVPGPVLVAVAGVQGGVGTTTLCVHLAGAWARWGPGPVLLADLAGGLGFRLDLTRDERGWDTLADRAGTLDGRQLAEQVVPFWPDWAVLPLPGLADGHAQPPPPPQVVAAVLRAAAERYRVIVVDLPPRPGPAGEVVLAAADVVLAVARPDSAGVRALQAADAAWSDPPTDPSTLAGAPPRRSGGGRVGLVVAGTGTRTPLSTREIRARLGDRLWALIPAAAEELDAAAEDGLLLLHQVEHPAVRAMLELAHRVLPLGAEAGAR